MSSKATRRLPRRLALLGLAALAGCGFVPVYGPGGGMSALHGATDIRAPANEASFRLRDQLLRRLGPNDAALYTLVTTISIRRVSVAVAKGRGSTRINLLGSSDYSLRAADGTTITSGSVSGFTGYSTTGTTVATEAAEADAEERLAVLLADQIMARLMAALAAQ